MKLTILAILAVMPALALAQVNGKFAGVDATAGYTYGGVAPTGQVLCGNGTAFVPATSCGAGIISYYQTVQANGSSRTQRNFLNFSSNFTVNDTNPSSTVDLAANISVNAATANSLSVIPAQCSGSTPYATGITANGNANCLAGTVSRGSFSSTGGSLTSGMQTVYDTGISVPSGGVVVASPVGGGLNAILSYTPAIGGANTVQISIRNTSSATITYGAVTWNYAIL